MPPRIIMLEKISRSNLCQTKSKCSACVRMLEPFHSTPYPRDSRSIHKKNRPQIKAGFAIQLPLHPTHPPRQATNSNAKFNASYRLSLSKYHIQYREIQPPCQEPSTYFSGKNSLKTIYISRKLTPNTNHLVIFPLKARRRAAHPVSQNADALNFHLHPVTVRQRAHPRWGAGQQDVPRLQGHHR